MWQPDRGTSPKGWLAVLASVASACFLLAGGVAMSIIATTITHRAPDTATGRVFAERMKGVVVYLTETERTYLHLSNWIAGLCFAVIAILILWSDRRRPN